MRDAFLHNGLTFGVTLYNVASIVERAPDVRYQHRVADARSADGDGSDDRR
jgi:hypothetical protein